MPPRYSKQFILRSLLISAALVLLTGACWYQLRRRPLPDTIHYQTHATYDLGDLGSCKLEIFVDLWPDIGLIPARIFFDKEPPDVRNIIERLEVTVTRLNDGAQRKVTVHTDRFTYSYCRLGSVIDIPTLVGNGMNSLFGGDSTTADYRLAVALVPKSATKTEAIAGSGPLLIHTYPAVIAPSVRDLVPRLF